MVFLPRLLEIGFTKYATFLAEHRRWFLVVPVVLTVLLGFGILRFEFRNNMLETYAPIGSEWNSDRVKFEQFFGLRNASMKYVLISSRNERKNDNLLKPKMARHVKAAISYIERNITVVDKNGKKLTFRPDLVMKESPYFFPNRLIYAMMNDYSNTRKIPRKLDYPVTEVLAQKMFLPFAFGGIELNKTTQKVKKASVVMLRYAVKNYTKELKRLSEDFEEKLFRFSESNHRALNAALDIRIFSWNSLVHEVRKNTFYTLPFAPPSFVLVLTFMLIICSSRKYSNSYHFHAMAGLISVLLSFISGMGFCMWCGLKYNDLVAVAAFLALAIGVDDTFIMLFAFWRHLPLENRVKRLQATLAEAGSSITFTSVTDIMAFGIGACIRLPALRDFCIFMAFAIAFDFLYQVTFFPAAMLYCEDLTKWSGEKLKMFKKGNRVWTKFFRPEFNVSPSKADIVDERIENVEDKAIPELNKNWWCLERVLYSIVKRPWCQSIIVVSTIIMTAFAAVGITRIKPNASFTKLMVDDSPTQRYVKLFDENFWQEALLFHVVVKSPDFSNATQINDFNRFVDILENTKHSVGRSATNLWIRDFMNYIDEWDIERKDVPKELSKYLSGETTSVEKDVKTIKRRLPNGEVLYIPDKFHFTVGYRGIKTWQDRADFLKNMSSLKQNFSQFQPAMFSEIIFMTDLLVYTESAMKQTMGVVMLCTFVIVMLFLPIQRCSVIFWISTSFLSINASVLGFLSFWHTDIDMISLISLLMSVGFSVDYTVHMAYQYSRQTDLDEEINIKRAVQNSLEAVSRPIALAGTSTLLGVCLTAFIRSYMIRVFLKTILLVVLLGLYQSLLVLPVLFILVEKGRKCKPKDILKTFGRD